MSSAMSEMRYFSVPSLDLECLLSVKAKIRQEGLLDSYLRNSLDFSIQTLEAFPASKRREVSLTLEGERHLVRITAGAPVLFYTVHLGSNAPRLLQKTHPETRLTASSLTESHFDGHHCCDELESCLEQARKALRNEEDKNPSVLDHMELKITCGELHLTYSTHQPLHTIHIQPRRRVYLGKTLSLEKILEMKTHLEKRGEMQKDLLVCFQHLLQHSDQYQEENARIVLQGDGEMLEFVSGRAENHTTQYFIFSDAQNKAHSQRVQDIELWEYD